MKIVIRVDASVYIGIGHVMRCLTLADELKRQGVEVSFICRDMDGHLGINIQQRGYEVSLLPKPDYDFIPSVNDPQHAKWLGVSWEQDAIETLQELGSTTLDWIIVDHYGIDYRWHKRLRICTDKIMVIDDLADRVLDCEILLDQTYGRCKEDYRSCVSDKSIMLLGSKYVLLRNEFAKLRPKALEKRKQKNEINRILVSMGGIDQDNKTAVVLEALKGISWEKQPVIDVVITKDNQYIDTLKVQADKHPLSIKFHVSVQNMAELMCEADLAIGAAGTTTWERCCLALPSITIKLAKNQEVILKQLEKIGAHLAVDVTLPELAKEVRKNIHLLLTDKEYMEQLSEKSATICHGNGAAWVGLEINPVLARDGERLELIEATINDADLILEWQGYPETRKFSNNPNIPERDEHIKWMKNKLESQTDYFWIMFHSGEPSGVIRIDYLYEKNGYLVSIFVIPKKYRLGIASGALTIAKRLFTYGSLYAQIMAENNASKSLFISAGFQQITDDMYCWNSDNYHQVMF